MRKHESEHHSQNLAWSKLTTITTFDRGKSESRKWKKENALVLSKGASATWSILVESLIDQLCKLSERDPVTQKILYNLICKKLCKMKLIDKTYKIEEYQFMRTYYQRALQKLLSISCSSTIDTKLETFLNQSPTALSLSPSIESVFSWSRYQTEFEEIEFIARGGFGRVFRVRNKVDGREYAIKKIYLRYRNENHFVRSLSEVRTLASLDHPNIVAYKAAWFEPFSDIVVETASSSDSSSPKISHGFYTTKSDSSLSEQDSRDVEEDSSNIVFTDRIEETSKKQESIPFSLKSSSVDDTCTPAKINEAETKERVTSISQSYYRKVSQYSKKNAKQSDQDSKTSSKAYKEGKVLSLQRAYEYAVLHIQMQLYKESLRDWLDSRNEWLQKKSLQTFSPKSEPGQNSNTESKESNQLKLDSESLYNALHIFMKILNGVEYVHAMHIIHHDLKPSNIFVEGYEYCCGNNEGKVANKYGGENGLNPVEKNRWSQVRVGDFGLACHLSHQMSSDVDNVEPKDKTLYVITTDFVDRMKSHVKLGGHAQGEEKVKEVIGTKLYAAPEQLDGHCNIQSDMYSLGIILFELLHPFFTAMERNKILSALRNGIIPENFELQYPNLVHLIRDLLSKNPNHRPAIKDLIKSIKICIREIKDHPGDHVSETLESDSSLFKDMVLVQETKTEHFVSVSHSESQITRKLIGISNDTWNEPSLERVNFITYACGSPTCYSVREKQEKTISMLIEKNLEKDEIILKLRQQISELQNAHSIVTTIEDNS